MLSEGTLNCAAHVKERGQNFILTLKGQVLFN